MANIMLIDEGDADTGAVERVLEWHGHHVFVVRDPRSVPGWLDRVRPDVILLDADMPGVDPLGPLRAIRRNAAQRDVPICVYAAGADDDTIGRVLRNGADRFIVTGGPDNIGRIGECIDEHLGAGVE